MKKHFFITGLLLLALGISFAQTLQFRQFHNFATHHYFYTTDPNENPAGWVNEGSVGRLYSLAIVGPIPLYRYVNNAEGGHYYTNNYGVAPGGYQLEGVIGGTSNLSPKAIYEHHSNTNNDFLYTYQSSGVAGYTLDGIAFYLSNN